MEQRKHGRVDFHAEAEVKCRDTVMNGKIKNLSMQGMFLDTDCRLSEDDALEITIRLTGASSQLSINLIGRVVRQADNGMAIAFKEMDLDSFIHLRNVVSHNSGDADGVMDEYYRSIGSARDS
jgi:hypothetical protein